MDEGVTLSKTPDAGWSVAAKPQNGLRAALILADSGLKADLAGLWRYQVGDYRILCQIKDQELLVLVVAVGHRKDIYE